MDDLLFFLAQGAIPESLKACKLGEDRCSILSVGLSAIEQPSKWEEKNVSTHICPVPWEVIQVSKSDVREGFEEEGYQELSLWEGVGKQFSLLRAVKRIG